MITVAELENGLTVIIEELSSVQSASYELLIPGGIILDREHGVGESLLLAEISTRGAGELSSRQLSDAFDDIGVRHSEGAGADRFAYRGSLLHAHLGRALELVSLMVCEPALPAEELPNIQSLLLQDILSLPDSPARRVMVELSQRYYPKPFERPSHGTEQGIRDATAASLRQLWKQSYAPRGSVLSIAGNVKTAQVLELCTQHFGRWSGQARILPTFANKPAGGYTHIDFDSAQLQIAFACPSAKFGDRDYYAAKLAAQVLSGGMFGRLFLEVREKRGLVYSVNARHMASQQFGMMLAYAGTTPERAQETLEVMLAEFERAAGTVTAEELSRAKANLKAALILSEESVASRASSHASDWWLQRRLRSTKEIHDAVDAVSLDALHAFFDAHPILDPTLVTLGSRTLNLSGLQAIGRQPAA
jgi:predicted Zn-dependent peptidase